MHLSTHLARRLARASQGKPSPGCSRREVRHASPTRGRAPSLAQRIREASTCKEVAALVEQGGVARELTLCLALTHLADLHARDERAGASASCLTANRAAFRRLAAAALRHPEQLTGFACADLGWAAAQTAVPLTPGQLEAWVLLAAEELPGAAEEQATLILAAAASMGALQALEEELQARGELERSALAALPPPPPPAANNIVGGRRPRPPAGPPRPLPARTPLPQPTPTGTSFFTF